jgi:hypothetical protein
VVFSTQWDFWVSASYALQGLERVRPDVLVLDPELLRRSWYVRGLGRRAPDLAQAARPALDRFLAEVRPFEAGRPFTPAVIEEAYVGMLDALIDAARASRPVLVTADVDRRFAPTMRRVPYGLALWLRPDSAYVAQAFPQWRFRPPGGETDPLAVTMRRLYAQILVSRAAYEDAGGHKGLAARYGEYALTFDPRIDPSRIPPLPLGGRDGVMEQQRYFDRVRAQVEAIRQAGSADTTGTEGSRPIP